MYDNEENLLPVISFGLLVFFGIGFMFYTIITNHQRDISTDSVLTEEFGRHTIEDTKHLDNGKIRYLITTSSKDKIVDEGYYVVTDSKGTEILETQKIPDTELQLRLSSIEDKEE